MTKDQAQKILRNRCAYREEFPLASRAQWIATDVLRQSSLLERQVFLEVLREDLPELLSTIAKLYPHRVKEVTK